MIETGKFLQALSGELGMTDAPEVAHAHILNQLLSRGHEFSFVQVLRLARKILESGKRRDLPDVSWLDKLRIRPELSLAFPAADVGRVEQTEDGLSITATFLSLYGSSSPLPTFYTEELLAEAAEDRSALRGFYDLFHQRLYQLYFQCWNKYNLLYRMVEEEYPLEQHRLLCLIGLAEDEMLAQVPDGRRMLRYVGLLSTFPRSAYGLKAMLEELLAPCKVRIAQNIFRRVPIPPDQRLCLGVSGCRLGVDAVLGSHVDDIQGKFRIEIGPLTWEQYNNLLPGTVLHDKLSKWVQFYVKSPLDVDLRLILAAGEARPLRLGDPETPPGSEQLEFCRRQPRRSQRPVSPCGFSRHLPGVGRGACQNVDSGRGKAELRSILSPGTGRSGPVAGRLCRRTSADGLHDPWTRRRSRGTAAHGRRRPHECPAAMADRG
jgi:type VI secretion system protein ImpH